ncbi:CDP-glycerol glycerophosphotransferase family protein [Methanobrevibacter sp.]|uniref:CDP-glycerol glycerophosphotransferase family protein n=1 Tax=Methanobrevibacter sp. TaxID=66852 RepID=UPI003870DB25
MSFKLKIKNRIETTKYSLINSLIYYNYYHKDIDEKLVYVESRSGKDFTGNVFKIVEELSTGKYGDFKIVVFAKKNIHSKIKELQKNYSLKIDRIISDRTNATMIMEKSKYIITDSVLYHKYIKRPNQIVLNTWHGTPQKAIGVNSSNKHMIASVQQTLFACDYLLMPNEYAKDKILSAYMMEKTYSGKILYGGYPRNGVFFNEVEKEKLKDKLGLNNKQIIAYMPTYKRLSLFRDKNHRKQVFEEILKEIDDNLDDNQLVLVKLHNANSNVNIDFNRFKRVKSFPKGYETYDVLNLADILITDYSSLLFDFANSRRKIVLFNHDEEIYSRKNKIYIPLSQLPFPKAGSVCDLICQINSPKDYDDSEFLEKFCYLDNINACEDLCKHVFNEEKTLKEEIIDNPKKNTLIFAGGLRKNGITSSLINLLSYVDAQEHDYFISYRSWSSYINRYFSDIFKAIPEDVELAPLRTKINPTFREQIALERYINRGNDASCPKIVENLFKREFKRLYSDFTFDNIIHFTGYGVNEILLFSATDSNKSIWAHGNMNKEIEMGKNNGTVLKNAYNSYDNVVVVSEESVDDIYKISGRKDNIRLIHNFNNYKKIIEDSQEDVEFQNETLVLCSNPDGINGVLNGPGKKFITIGRFSEEKNHDLLIDAFNEFCLKYPDTQLIIIGGHGPEYFKTRRRAEKSEFGHNITIIRSVFNPMPILKKCDLFILPSKREGWPMTLMEANSLKVPIIASDMPTTQWLKKYGAYLFENDIDGIVKGMNEYMDGNVKDIQIDYDEYNNNALKEFLEIIDD